MHCTTISCMCRATSLVNETYGDGKVNSKAYFSVRLTLVCTQYCLYLQRATVKWTIQKCNTQKWCCWTVASKAHSSSTTLVSCLWAPLTFASLGQQSVFNQSVLRDTVPRGWSYEVSLKGNARWTRLCLTIWRQEFTIHIRTRMQANTANTND